MLTCKQTLAVLGDYLDQALSEEARAAVEAHVRACPVCDHLAKTYVRTTRLCHDALRWADADAPLGRLLERLRHEFKK